MSLDQLRVSTDARFSCQSCGRCCTRWSVTVSEQKVEQLRKHDWAGEPFEKNPGPGDPFRTRMVNGRCFFLDEKNQCRIHTRLGYDAKPDGCKAFPLMFTDIDGVSYARLSHYCPTVARGTGKRLVDQQRWLRETYKNVGGGTREAEMTLDDTQPLTPRQLSTIETKLLEIVKRKEVPWTDRIAALSGIVRYLINDQRSINDRVASLASISTEELLNIGQQGGAGAKGGSVLALFLGQDAAPRKLARASHFVGVRLANIGLIALHSEFLQAKARWAKIRGVQFQLDEASNSALTHYLASKIESRRYLADELSVLRGLNLICVGAAIVNVLARMNAATQNNPETALPDIQRGIEGADLLVLEHTTLLQTQPYATLTRSVLSDQTLPISLLLRLK